MNSYALLLLFLITICYPIACLAQSPNKPNQSIHSRGTTNSASNYRPITNNDFTVYNPVFNGQNLIGMHCECNLLKDGVPTASASARRFYYLPFMALEKDKAGKFIAFERNPGEVVIPIVFDPSKALTSKIFQEYLLSNNLIDNVKEGNIAMVELSGIFIETIKTYKYRIQFELPGLPNTDKGEVTARIDDPSVLSQFLNDFQAGKVAFTGRLFFKGINDVSNSAIIEFDRLKKTTVYNSMSGLGGKGLMNRQKMGKLAREAVTRQGIYIRTEYEDPDFMDLVNGLIQDFREEQKNFSKDSTQWDKNFLEFGFDKNDFKADLITASHSILDQQNQSKFQSELENVSKVGGSAGFLGISASASVELKEYGKVLKEVLNNYKVDYDEKGERIIPKSVNLYQFDESIWRSKGIFSIGKVKVYTGEGSKPIQISPSLNFFTLDNTREVLPLETQFVPVGTIVAFAGTIAPTGWFVCDGRELDALQYPELAQILGTNWGSANSGRLKLPDLRGKFLRGLDPTGTADPDGKNRIIGDKGDFQKDATKKPNNEFITNEKGDHNHGGFSYPWQDIFQSIHDNGWRLQVNLDNQDWSGVAKADKWKNDDSDLIKRSPERNFAFQTSEKGAHTHIISGGGDAETRPKNVAVQYIIKAK